MSIAAASEAQKRSCNDDEDFNSPDVKKIRYELFDILDESDTDPNMHDLDSVMKLLEKEISASSPVTTSQPEFGYLLGASDGDLGLPPSSAEVAPILDLGEIWGFEEADATSFGVGDDESGYLALDGLFDHSDVVYGPTDIGSRSESMPAQ